RYVRCVSSGADTAVGERVGFGETVGVVVGCCVVVMLHSSRPMVPSFAIKEMRVPARVSSLGSALLLPGARSCTILVLLAVPSLTHSSLPCVWSAALK